jgi:hypothetical protein
MCSTRIGLEKENKYDKMRDMEHPGGANQRTSIEFRKHRQLADKGGPVGISYQIRPKAPEGKSAVDVTSARDVVVVMLCWQCSVP